jgi:hypothetical protein
MSGHPQESPALQLAQLDRALLTRSDLETLFGVSRARAAQLLHRFGAIRVGSQLVLDRTALIRTLTVIRRGRPAQRAAARRAALLTALHRARLEAVRVTVPPAAWETQVAGLPDGVALGAGRIEVRFDSVPEALQKLFTLAQAISNDYDRFAALVSGEADAPAGESTP